jgi:hypothetical protein
MGSFFIPMLAMVEKTLASSHGVMQLDPMAVPSSDFNSVSMPNLLAQKSTSLVPTSAMTLRVGTFIDFIIASRTVTSPL